LTGKKREEQVLLEKVALKYKINIEKIIKNKKGPDRYLINQSNFLYLKPLKEIYEFSYQYAIDEYEFYLRIDSFIKDESTRYVNNVLINFSQDFIFDVRSGYFEFLSKYTGKPPVKELHLLRDNQRKDLVYN
jgi:hypothetical protein